MNLRFGYRLGLIFVAAIVLVMLVLIGAAAMLRSRYADDGVVLPFPKQVAAIVALVEDTPPGQADALFAAINTPAFQVSLSDRMPAVKGAVEMPAATTIMKAYLAVLGGRSIDVMVSLSDPDLRPQVQLRGKGIWVSCPVRLVIGLKDGRILTVIATNPVSNRLTGLRLAVLVLLTTLVIAGGALWLLQRQVRPLESLSLAIDKFGNTLETSQLPERGSPELRRLIAGFNRLQANIHLLVAGRTRMLAAIGHDLGTYLTRLRLRVEAIGDEAMRERAIKDIDDMSRLMADTLLLAKYDTQISQDAIDIVPVIRRQAESFASAGGEVRFSGVEDAVPVRISASTLERMVANLVSNALKYGEEALIAVEMEGGMAQIRVEDRGPGIAPELRTHVLEPFFRLDAARNLNQGGFGLGLAIVADLVRRHDGAILLEDRLGGGLCVRLRLPLAQA